MSTLLEFGAQLRARRRSLGESQAEVAAALGVTRQWLARLEAGTGNPDLRQLFALCDHLGLHITAVASAERVAGRTPPAAPGATHPHPVVPARYRGGGAPEVDLDQLLASFSGPGPEPPPLPARPAGVMKGDSLRG